MRKPRWMKQRCDCGRAAAHWFGGPECERCYQFRMIAQEHYTHHRMETYDGQRQQFIDDNFGLPEYRVPDRNVARAYGLA